MVNTDKAYNSRCLRYSYGKWVVIDVTKSFILMESESNGMYRKNNALTIVFNGDWYNLHTQPDWMAKNVFESDAIEVGLGGNVNSYTILYKLNNVTVNPSQNKMMFTALNAEEETMELFYKCVNNFLEKATTPGIVSYGLNAEFIDDGAIYAETVDRMVDTTNLVDYGCEIQKTQVSRMIQLNGDIYNFDCSLTGKEFLLHINEHHTVSFDEENVQKVDSVWINKFLKNCWIIAQALGYEEEQHE